MAKRKANIEVLIPDKVFCAECGCPHEIDGKCVSCEAPWPEQE